VAKIKGFPKKNTLVSTSVAKTMLHTKNLRNENKMYYTTIRPATSEAHAHTPAFSAPKRAGRSPHQSGERIPIALCPRTLRQKGQRSVKVSLPVDVQSSEFMYIE